MKFYRIQWTKKAIQQLESIADYYSEFSLKAAQSIVSSVFQKTTLLEIYPLAYPLEPLLESKKLEHRYMICGNYKIIFRVVESKIFIQAIFDCRQNPKKMKRLV